MKEIQNKYDECVKLLAELHDVIAMTLSVTDDERVLALSPADLVKEALKGIETLNNMSDTELAALDKHLGLDSVQADVVKNKNDVVVLIDESVTKGVLQ